MHADPEAGGARALADADVRADDLLFRELADTAPAMLWVTDPEGTCTFLSRRWYEFTGQTEAQGLGFGWLDAVHPEDRGGAQREFIAANETRRAFELEHRLRTRTGEWRWVIDAGSPRFSRGEFKGYVGSVTDIHERVLAERSLRMGHDRLDLVLEAGRIGLWHCELPFGELDWNARVKGHFGLPPEARVTIDTFWERIHPEDRENTRLAIERSIGERAPYDVEYRTVGLDGETRWIRAMGRAHFDAAGVAQSFDGVTVDVTERVRHNHELREADRRKDEFLAILAHELRNPLAPIGSGLALLEVAGDRPEVAARARASMSRQLRHLVRLVDDLLDVSRISRGRLEIRPASVPLADIVRHAIDIARPALEGRGHRFQADEVDPSIVIEADATRLAQALSNLLHNAAKFTPPGGEVALEVRTGPGQIELRVRDNGTGIAPEERERIFGMFTQAALAPGEVAASGLGIGLALAHTLVALHGGTLHAESEGRGRGAQFILTLPRDGGN